MRYALVLAGLLTAGQVAAEPSLHLRSPPERVPVLELFTSHGCSSCPPAGRWLRRFAERPGLWTEVIPLAFHVDYWDGLGWPDRFASEGFSRRQRDYRRTGHVNSVYTPGFVLNGREWRGWFRGRQPELSPGRRVGTLSLNMDRGGSALLRFEPAGRPQAAALTRISHHPPAAARDLPASTALRSDRVLDVVSATPPRPACRAPYSHGHLPHLATGCGEKCGLRAHLAVLGFGLSTPVDGGENAGRVLKEDFVVLGYRNTAQTGNKRQWTVALPQTVPAETSRRAVVAWVSAGDDPAPIQAVAGWLP